MGVYSIFHATFNWTPHVTASNTDHCILSCLDTNRLVQFFGPRLTNCAKVSKFCQIWLHWWSIDCTSNGEQFHSKNFTSKIFSQRKNCRFFPNFVIFEQLAIKLKFYFRRYESFYKLFFSKNHFTKVKVNARKYLLSKTDNFKFWRWSVYIFKCAIPGLFLFIFVFSNKQ